MTDSAKPVHFLLVEDDDDHADLVQRALMDNRVINKVDRVVDGAQALAYVRKEGEYTDRGKPDVILLDLKLPGVDGHEVLAALKNDPKLCTIPVVVLTTSMTEVDRAKAYMEGVNSYLVKPLDFTRFNQMIHDLRFYWAVWNQPPNGVSKPDGA